MGKNNRFKSATSSLQPARQDGKKRSAVYNYTEMKEDATMAEKGFAQQLSRLRTARGVSAREMSLSLGQGAGYINNIENGHNLPSMAMFFEICEYLSVTPREFMGYTASEDRDAELEDALAGLDADCFELVIRLIGLLSKERNEK